MRISDWSSDVCSSDLSCSRLLRQPDDHGGAVARQAVDHQLAAVQFGQPAGDRQAEAGAADGTRGLAGVDLAAAVGLQRPLDLPRRHAGPFVAPPDTALLAVPEVIGKASCRARVCQYV